MNWDDLETEEETPTEPFNSKELAKYFVDRVKTAPFNNGFAVTNMLALQAQIKKWQGTHTPDTIRRVIDAYFDDKTNRGKNPGWRDFLLQADRIAGKVLSPGGKTQQVDKWAKYR